MRLRAFARCYHCQVAGRVVKQYRLDPYDDPATQGMFDDYLHLAFQFG